MQQIYHDSIQFYHFKKIDKIELRNACIAHIIEPTKHTRRGDLNA